MSLDNGLFGSTDLQTILFRKSMFISFNRSRSRAKSMSIEVDLDRSRFRYITSFRLGWRSMLILCFSESARKMMQHVGRVVAIGLFFDTVLDISMR